MKKNIFSLALIVVCTSILMIITATPRTAILTSAMSFTNVDLQMEILREKSAMSIAPFPTMHPFNGTVLSANTTPQPTSNPTTTAIQFLTSSPTPSPTAVTPPTLSTTDQIVNLVNAERAKVGLNVLTKNSALAISAQKYAQYMADKNFFNHNGVDGSTFITRDAAAGYTNYRWIGENIAAGQATPAEAMKDWMNSSGHKANILSANAKEIGIGFVTAPSSKYRYYWVQEFGAR